MAEQTTETDGLALRLLGVIRAHANCGAEANVDVHEDRTGTLHYPCGAAVGQVRGLVDADQRHLADALAREALHHVCPPEQETEPAPCEHDGLGCGWRVEHEPHTKVGDGRPCCGWPPRCDG